MKRFAHTFPCIAVWSALSFAVGFVGAVENPRREGGWLVDQQPQVQVRTMEMTLHPQAEPRPALKHRLLPDEFDMVDGNAAIYYLKAMGFLEQSIARDKLSEYLREAAQRAQAEDKDYAEIPPYSWQSMPPAELPLDQVKAFLQFTSFQPRYLREAAKRRSMDLDRRIRNDTDPIGYLLPEVQVMRELARMQNLRCKVAIAEDRIDDAIAILGQQYAMARHLGQDEFLVSNLVGIACGAIAWEDVLYLIQHPRAPNLYWAFAALPRPFFDLRQANAYERQLLYEQIKVLREVDETPRPAGYWREFIARMAPQFGSLTSELGLSSAALQDADSLREAIVGFVALAYPGAKRYLIEQCGMAREQVEAYPTAQTVFLAVVRFYDEARDDVFKWNYLPYSQDESGDRSRQPLESLGARSEEFGWCALPTFQLLPAVIATKTAAIRGQQMIAMVQAVEAIRMYGAAHEGKLPATLDALPFPAPLEPVTGQPLDYQVDGDKAILSGHRLPGLQYRLVLRFAKETTR